MSSKVRVQASIATGCQATSINLTPLSLGQSVAQKSWMATLALLLGLGTGLWFAVEVNVPGIVQAQTARVDLAIERQPNETYEALLNRATAAARAEVQKSFAQNSEATNASITVVAHHQGAIAPVLSLEVSRSEWASNPDLQRSITYFNTARSLLRFDQELATTNSNSPSGTTPSRQSRPARPTIPRQSQNNQPRSARERVNGTFTQPGTLISPPASSGQPVNNNSSSPTGTGTTINPTTSPNGQTAAPGTGLTPQPGVAAPVPSSVNSPSSTPTPGAGLTPQPAVAAPVPSSVNSPSSTSPNISPSLPSTSTPSNAPQNPFNSSGNLNSTSPGTIQNQNSTTPSNPSPDNRED